ncbi:hypothetical protein [Cyclobacterium marinum]|uniref:Uncharacterized protein n=1 Tax=Cyclobacterium marinum (strain ATCC 25205 / DSM 745 / LMG 13164 / NCIMB 1802) TaxID=880070 RepID=G0J4I8_CYCMS|nr:hypothetical protein [Cyclobacterium marinum]AEL24653.1 hypothetical protein Cycma_0881 [Cyclobacterium marinum DSM 745]
MLSKRKVITDISISIQRRIVYKSQKPHRGVTFVAKAAKPWSKHEAQSDFGGIVAFFSATMLTKSFSPIVIQISTCSFLPLSCSASGQVLSEFQIRAGFDNTNGKSLPTQKHRRCGIFVAKAAKPWSKHEAQSDFGGIVAFFLQQC